MTAKGILHCLVEMTPRRITPSRPTRRTPAVSVASTRVWILTKSPQMALISQDRMGDVSPVSADSVGEMANAPSWGAGSTLSWREDQWYGNPRESGAFGNRRYAAVGSIGGRKDRCVIAEAASADLRACSGMR